MEKQRERERGVQGQTRVLSEAGCSWNEDTGSRGQTRCISSFRQIEISFRRGSRCPACELLLHRRGLPSNWSVRWQEEGWRSRISISLPSILLKTIRFVPLPISNVSRPPRFSSLRNSPFRGKKAFSPRHLYFVFLFLSLRFIFYSRDRGRSKMRWINFEILFAGLRMFPLYGNFSAQGYVSKSGFFTEENNFV